MPDLYLTLHRHAEALYDNRDGDLDVADALSVAASVLEVPDPAGARKKLVAVIAKGNHRPDDLELLNQALAAIDKQHAAGMQTERDHAAYLLEQRSAMEAPNAAEALRFMASVIRENRTLPPIMLGTACGSVRND